MHPINKMRRNKNIETSARSPRGHADLQHHTFETTLWTRSARTECRQNHGERRRPQLTRLQCDGFCSKWPLLPFGLRVCCLLPEEDVWLSVCLSLFLLAATAPHSQIIGQNAAPRGPAGGRRLWRRPSPTSSPSASSSSSPTAGCGRGWTEGGWRSLEV